MHVMHCTSVAALSVPSTRADFRNLRQVTSPDSYVMREQYCNLPVIGLQERECEEQFHSMLQAGGLVSPAQLVDTYVTAEASNFELFNEVASINAQAAQLQQLIGQQQLLIGRLR